MNPGLVQRGRSLREVLAALAIERQNTADALVTETRLKAVASVYHHAKIFPGNRAVQAVATWYLRRAVTR